MIGTPIFTILVALCGYGWNYYGLKIKEVDALKKESMTASKDTSQNIKNVYNIGGDIVYGDKKTIIKKNDSTNIRLSKAFQNLKSIDYTQRNIAIDYIINNFPAILSDNQIEGLIETNPISSSNLSVIEEKLCYLLATQKKSKNIENYFKQVISHNASNAIAWHYLLREDVNIDSSYIFSVIKDKPNHCLSYANIVQYAMDIDNGRVCKELLNSKDLVDFLISNSDEKNYLQQCYNWINKMIDRKSSYKKYETTYFFKTVIF